MFQLLSFALFAGVFAISIGAIMATVQTEMPFILRALGIVPAPARPPLPIAERRVRVTRRVSGRPLAGPALCAAA